jgi:3-oxoadipate enol-lactonase
MTTPYLHRVREGTGPTVLLSHALGCDHTMWDGVASLLAGDFTVLRYDHRGHGASAMPGGPCSMDMLADDAARLVREESGDAVHVVGLSMGGMTAQALAARYPQLVASVVIANSANWYDDAARAMWRARVDTVRAQGVAPIADGAMQRWFTPGFRADPAGAKQVARLRAVLEQTDTAAYAASCEAVAAIDLRASNARIGCPALVVAGSRDEATPPAQSADIAARIPGAQSRTLDAAHLSAVEQPEAFVKLLHEFWNGSRA